MANNKTYTLRKTETIALRGIATRLEEIQRTYVEPINNDLQEILRDIEDRLGLPEHALNNTHSLDFNSGLVRELVDNGEDTTADESEASPS